MNVLDILPELTDVVVDSRHCDNCSPASIYISKSGIDVTINLVDKIRMVDYPKGLFPQFLKVPKIAISRLNSGCQIFKRLHNRFSKLVFRVNKNPLCVDLYKLMGFCATHTCDSDPVDSMIYLYLVDIQDDILVVDSLLCQLNWGHNYDFDINVALQISVDKSIQNWLLKSFKNYVESIIQDWMIDKDSKLFRDAE